MAVIVISYREECDEIAMGCRVGCFESRLVVQGFNNDYDAAEHVGRLNGWNDPGAYNYRHYFVYDERNFPHDVHYALNLTNVDISQPNHCVDKPGIPTHLQEIVDRVQKAEEVAAQLYREDLEKERQAELEERHRSQQKAEYERLHKIFGEFGEDD